MTDKPERDLERMFTRQIRDARGMRIDDLQAYQRLLKLADELERLSEGCWSVASGTSLRMAATAARRLASKVYRRSLRRPQ